MDILDLVWAIEAVSAALDGLTDAEPLIDGISISELDIDIPKDIKRYTDYLYKLYEIAQHQGILADVKQALKEDDANMYFFNEIDDELSYLAEEKAHEDIMYSVQEGDKVRLSNGNIFYAVSIDGNDLWVSKKLGDPNGWYADLSDVVEILE